jgi:hypothetical protein
MLTFTISKIATRILGREFPGVSMTIRESSYSILGTMAYIDMPDIYPNLPFILLNILTVVILILFLGSGRRKGKPIAIFFMLSLLIHMITCVYFLFAQTEFPYSIGQFSDLYMKQQIGIWITFTILAGIVTGFLGGRGYLYKVLAFATIMIYSILFGGIRYILFLYILHRFSLLYMGLMFFSFGPLFDFLYLVAIYALLTDKLTRMYDSQKGRAEWKWS